MNSASIDSPVEQQSVAIPACYAPFSEVFCPKKASLLPPHWQWDCTIDIYLGEPVPHGKIFPISLPEQEAMEEYIKEASSLCQKRMEACSLELTTELSTRFTAELLFIHVFYRIPEDTVSDRGPQFISQVWKPFLNS